MLSIESPSKTHRQVHKRGAGGRGRQTASLKGTSVSAQVCAAGRARGTAGDAPASTGKQEFEHRQCAALQRAPQHSRPLFGHFGGACVGRWAPSAGRRRARTRPDTSRAGAARRSTQSAAATRWSPRPSPPAACAPGWRTGRLPPAATRACPPPARRRRRSPCTRGRARQPFQGLRLQHREARQRDRVSAVQLPKP